MATLKKKTTDVTEEGSAPVPKKVTRTRVAKTKTPDVVEEKTTEAEIIDVAERVKGGSLISAIGRRKTAVARVQLIKNGKGVITINGRTLEAYFGNAQHQEQVKAPLKVAGMENAVDVSAKVLGGGSRGQAEAVRHGISRTLEKLNPTYRPSLKKQGYLTRDPRKRERKKFGKKSARRSPQWSKR